MKRIFSLLASKKLAIAWLLCISILFCLPGTALPRQSWLDGLHLDKWVHAGFFALLVSAWLSAFRLPVWAVTGGALLYGIVVELIQHQWIAYRSFDVWDVLADAAGIVLGYIVWVKVKRFLVRV